MSTLTLPTPVTYPRRPSAPSSPRPLRWTCEQFHMAGDHGLFEGRNIILINGDLIEMPSTNPPHTTARTLTEMLFGKEYLVRGQEPLILGSTIDPVPDIAVLKGNVRDYAKNHSKTALLIVEINDSSLDYDTTTKASLYASAGIADYCVVDLNNRRLLVYRDPVADETKPFGFRYASVVHFAAGQATSPLALPSTTIDLAEMLP